MNDKILCIYYSRTGGTKQAVEEIASALDCECLALHDKVDRSGALGFLRCCMDAVRKRTSPVSRPQSARPLADYELVVLGTPIWAGRCSSIMRGFLKRRGYELQNTAYVVTHRSGELYRDVYRQMDLYLQTPHVADVSLRVGSAGYHFWRDRFIKTCADFVAEDKS